MDTSLFAKGLLGLARRSSIIDGLAKTLEPRQDAQGSKASTSQLKVLMRNSKLEGMRKTLNVCRQASDGEAKGRAPKKSQARFAMKKCSKCDLYYPLNKLTVHFTNCNFQKN